MKDILRERDWAKKLAGLRNSQHPQAQFLWAVFRDVFHYCALHLEVIANNARDLDFAVRWGFGWDSGPFEIWQAAGWQQVAGWISADIAAGKAMATHRCPPGSPIQPHRRALRKVPMHRRKIKSLPTSLCQREE